MLGSEFRCLGFGRPKKKRRKEEAQKSEVEKRLIKE
jgi:hypothetical protein